MQDLNKKIQDLEKQIAQCPAGYISNKTIGGKVKQYLQWTEDGKKKSKYLDTETAKLLAKEIDKRRDLQKQLKELKTKAILQKTAKTATLEVSEDVSPYKTNVLTGKRLSYFVESVHNLKARKYLKDIQDYLFGQNQEKVLVLFGLRRTGKTTLIRQAIAAMNKADFDKAAFVQIKTGDALSDINFDLKLLQKQGYLYIFLDEVTFMEDFIQGAALFSDIYAASGMKIVLTGTDSLGFVFTQDEQLYDRCTIIHTTWISYKEFEDVLGIHGIDNYISYGGTMSLGGINYNQSSTFANTKRTEEYVDSAIAKNIQHSLKYYQNSGHFRSLEALYEKNELTGAINRIIEDINHRFTLEVLTKDFESHDLGLSANNLRKDRIKPTDILDKIDKQTVTAKLKEILEIKNKTEQTVTITDAHRAEIKEYLNLLDLTVDIPVETFPIENIKKYKTVISQPGLRYSQAKALIEQLLLDPTFQNISAQDRSDITKRILDEIKGRMLEEIVLLETKHAFPNKHVFKLQFAVGEFDMVVADPDTTTCEIFEIKHTTNASPQQLRHLEDPEKCSQTAFRYGPITKKYILYRGQSHTTATGIAYRNVEEYLKTF